MANDSQDVHLARNSLHIGHLTYLRLHNYFYGYRFTRGQMNSRFDDSERAGTDGLSQKVISYLLAALLLRNLTVHYSYNLLQSRKISITALLESFFLASAAYLLHLQQSLMSLIFKYFVD